MQVEKYIGELLFEHDCVIVSGFGGFVCNYAPASIVPAKSQFRPPYKKISFNRNLKSNDGLLANHISQQEKISYPEANSAIAGFVEQINLELQTQRHYDLKNIGAFYFGEENALLFDQDETVNYLAESFGLSTFHVPAIKREPIERRIEKKFQDIKIIPSAEKKEIPAVRKRIPVVRYLAVAASVLIFGSLIFVSYTSGLFNNAGFANLNPFAKKIQPVYRPSEINLPDIKSSSVSLALPANDTAVYVSVTLDKNIPVVMCVKEDKTTVKKSNAPKHGMKGGFHIIGGAFAVPANAEKFKMKLEKLGYDAAIIERKLELVSYGSYATQEEAERAFEKIRAVQHDVWLMKN
ncbi:MAG TPA: SPOR domain-containing protein [Bacteroidia bacterium]